MPYLAHFGLREHPFTLTPNTNQYFPIDSHAEIIEAIKFGIARNTGILKVVGDVGTGKTMLCRLLLRKLVTENDSVAYLNAPQVDLDSLIELVCTEFGLEAGSQSQMLQSLNTFLLEQHAAGRNAVLIVDESQALGPKGLETVRLLSNLETERNKLLQIVLFGQSELDELLARDDLRQINQRIGFSFNTGPLTLAEAHNYVAHRVARARLDGVAFPVFSEDAVRRIAIASALVPRVINILADKALLAAYGEGSIQVTEAHAQAAIDDSPQLVTSSAAAGNLLPWLLGAGLAVQGGAITALLALHPSLAASAAELFLAPLGLNG